MGSALIPVDDLSRVAEVRRTAVACGAAEGFTDSESSDLAIIATEAATNLARHAQSGEVHIQRLSSFGRAGVEILSIDRGPGMTDPDRCCGDGFSTAGTSGTGLGAIFRLSHESDIYSQPGGGTVLVARRYGRSGSAGEGPTGWQIGAVLVPCSGESACGDNWAIRAAGDGLYVLVVDGLGHGLLAAQAASAATSAFLEATEHAAAAILERIHGALRPTRGAAAAVVKIAPGRQRAFYAGLGNIVGTILNDGKPQHLVSHNGTAGHAARRIQEFEYPFPRGSCFVMHSDGLRSSWNLDRYPGLAARHPALIAGVLYRDSARGRDDVCVLAGRPR